MTKAAEQYRAALAEAKPKKGFGGKKHHALGRMKAGTMNKTETAYARYLDTLKSLGDVLWWDFEGIKLRLADSTFLTMDFAVLNQHHEIELVDVKGSFSMIEEDAWAKTKIAASLYPFRFFIVAPIDRKFSAWKVEEV
jgi:hypothetical protein